MSAGPTPTHLRDPDQALLRVEDLVVDFATRHGVVQAVAGVSLDVLPGETVGLVGESGCGKSTLGRTILRLHEPRSGSIRFAGADVTHMRRGDLRRVRRQLQMIFQDPISSLNPRRRVRDIVAEPLRIGSPGLGASEVRDAVDSMLEAVGLDPAVAADRYPHQFSGGQCQRICIARALMLRPKLVICDEPVSALDVSVQAQVLNLLEDLKARFGLALLFVSHDLGVVKVVSDRVAVMYLGRLCETGTPDTLFDRPAHPYTAALLESVPVPDPERRRDRSHRVTGDLPSPLDPPSGCRFRTRCDRATDLCRTEEPPMRAVGPDQHVACHHPLVGADPTDTGPTTATAPGPTATPVPIGTERS
ncbi:MAG: ABC transporter ATP-binding protein [Acidimicrobiia bacterium]